MKTRSIFFAIITAIIFSVIACTPKVQTVTKSKTEVIPSNNAVAVINEERTSIDPKQELEKKILNKKLPVDPSFRMGVLKNGMHYFIKKNTKPENRVELRLAVKAGSILEDEDQKGLAHFIEHMQFNGSEHFSKNDLVNYLEKVGTQFGPDLNAYTGFDETVYMLQVRTDVENQLDTGLLVIYDWAGKASFDPEEIDKERGVVISEWRSGLSPDQRMRNKYLPVMLKGSRYAERLPIGDPDIVKNADYNTIKRFYHDWYRPDLMAVIVVGDINVDKMESKIKSMFSNNKNPDIEKPRKEYSVPPQKGTDVVVVSDKEAPFTVVQILNKLPHIEIKTKADLLASLERRLFNMMLNARLEEIKNSPNPPFTFSFTGYSKNIGDIDSYMSYAMVPEGKAIDAIKTFTEENMKVLKFGFTKSEFDRQKKNLVKNVERAYKEKDKTESRNYANDAIYYFLQNNPMLSEEQFYNFVKLYIDDLKLQEVNNLAKHWITDDNRVIIVTGPDKDNVKLPTKEDILDAIKSTQAKQIDAYVDNVSKKPFFNKNLSPAPIVDSKSFDDYGIKKLVLSNGIEAYLKKTDFKNNEVSFTAYSPGGTSLYDDEDYNDAKWASQAINQMGLSEFSNTQLNKLLTGKQVSVQPSISSLYENMHGKTTTEDMETMFQMINLYFTAPRKDSDAFKSFVLRNSGLYGNLLKNPQYYFINESTNIKFNNNLRAGSFPTAEELNNLNLDKMFNIYKNRFSDASDFKFFFVGNFDEDKITGMIQKYLGNLPSKGRKEKGIDRHVYMQNGQIKKTLYYGEAPKTYVDITFHGDFDWNKDNEYILNSMVNVLKIKLRESLREDKGGVYGVRVYGYASNEPKENYVINISFNSDPDNTQNLIDAAFEVINKLQTEGPDDEVMTKVTETQKQSKVKNLKENRYWLNKMRAIVQDNLDFSEIKMETLENRISKLTKDVVKQAAIKYLNNNNMIQIEMYPEKYKK